MEINNEKLNTTIENGKKLKNKYAKARFIPYYIGYLVVIGIMFTTSFITDGVFDFTKVQDPFFWGVNAVTAVAIGIMAYTSIPQKMEEKEENDEELKKINALFVQKVKDSKYSNEDLMEYITKINRENKILAYKTRIENKINKLNHSIFTTAKAIKIWQEGSDEEKARNGYCKKRMKLEAMIDPKYIESTIDYLTVDYWEWSFPSLMAGIDLNKINNKHHVTKQEFISKNAFKKMLTKMILPCVTSILVVTIDFKDPSSLLNLFIRLLSVIFTYVGSDKLAADYLSQERSFGFERINFFNSFNEYEERAKLEEKTKIVETLSQSDKTTLETPENRQIQQDTVTQTSENIENKLNTELNQVTTQATVSPASNIGG